MKMELQKHQKSSTKQSPSKGGRSGKFVGVRQRPSGKWVAEIKNTSQKIRMWLGTFDTAEEAAQAYNEAACLLRGSNTRTNLLNHPPPNPALSLKIRNLLNQKMKSPPKNTKVVDDVPSGGRTITTTTSSGGEINHQKFDDAYKPDLSNCFCCCCLVGVGGGFETTGYPCYINHNPAGERDGFEVPKSGDEMQIAEFEASKHALNVLWENVHDYDAMLLSQMFNYNSIT